jgi:hypothetical protein
MTNLEVLENLECGFYPYQLAQRVIGA